MKAGISGNHRPSSLRPGTGRRLSRKKSLGSTLMLTPMVDMFSLLVIFLLQFLGSPSEQNLSVALALPTAQMSGLSDKKTNISISSKGEVFWEDQLVGEIGGVLAGKINFPNDFPKKFHDSSKTLGNEPPQISVDLFADRSLDSEVVGQMIALLGRKGASQIQLMTEGKL